MNDQTFTCTKCGACCKKLNTVSAFAHMADENGKCFHLSKNNTCNIYDTRPDLCRGEFVYLLYFAKTMERSAFVSMTEKLCDQIRRDVI